MNLRIIMLSEKKLDQNIKDILYDSIDIKF